MAAPEKIGAAQVVALMLFFNEGKRERESLYYGKKDNERALA